MQDIQYKILDSLFDDPIQPIGYIRLAAGALQEALHTAFIEGQIIATKSVSGRRRSEQMKETMHNHITPFRRCSIAKLAKSMS